MEKTKIKRWKMPVIRWALRELKPLLPALHKSTYETLSKFGIADIVNDDGDISIYLD
jgi:hypothetical protein